VKPERTPRGVALASALLVTGLTAISYAMTVYFLDHNVEWLWIAVLILLGFPISYFTIHFFIEKFLYHKVKIIYKTIHQLKSRGERTRIEMGSDVLGQINEEVADWAEERIREIKELQAADNFRRDFIGNLAHELKTPLFTIQGYLETVLDSDMGDQVTARQFLEKANKSCDRLAGLIKDLDQITRFESGNVPLDISRFDVVDLSRHCTESLEQMASEKNITLTLRNPNERPIYVNGDKGKIEQVILNLLVNSINYGRENGETRIRFYDMADNILIEVADDGIGMAKHHLARVFERFYRVDTSRSRHEGGSGLGLAICKHIIESHGQTITVRSSEGVGSTFGFTLQKAP
jgi:two-component system phosphate regulon sensor histidine kinase PhoR